MLAQIKQALNRLNGNKAIEQKRKESQDIFDRRQSFLEKWGKDYLEVLRELTLVK